MLGALLVRARVRVRVRIRVRVRVRVRGRVRVRHVLGALRLARAALATHNDGLVRALRRGAAVRLLRHGEI